MSKDCFQIYENLPLSIQDREDIGKIMDALDSHFLPKTNVIYELYIFNQQTRCPKNPLMIICVDSES